MALLATWETCMQVKKQQLKPDMEQWTHSKLGKEYVKAVYCHPAYLTCIQSTPCKTPDWRKHKLESRLPGEIPKTLDMWMTPPLWQKAKRNCRGSWWKWKSWWKTWLKTQHSKNEDHGILSHHFMHIDGETMETVTDFIFGAPKLLQMMTAAMKLKDAVFLEQKLWPT